MIHVLLALTRPLFVLDCETTGVDPQKDRIAEIGFQQWGAEGMAKEWRTLVNHGVPIPASATKVHGITDAMVQGCRDCGRAEREHHQIEGSCTGFLPWPMFKHIAHSLAKGLSNCDFAGKKVRFDLRIVTAEMSRANQPWSYDGARIVDAERLEQIAVPRDLGSLHEKYTGKRHDGAHDALSDVQASTTVIVRQLETYPALPRDLDRLHALQWPDWIDNGGSFRMLDGVPTIMFGKHRGTPMRDVPINYYDWILGSGFPADVKRLAAEAKVGRFPEERA